ncbi:MAG: UDP-N-acetylglucosamine--N-acetylmuramyl-(pentapeptide) pyrophosphoryl-undecaprenol N-acetylglucosamine transferase [Phycisphaerales bacterium]|nr:UDP-N-acetylglucosamine--N-acetylmuramyl-(pentapeptide) pyrophosphoryl-undecaprenol N-acetylglucosamine transferase [Planctomycetota bacterium]MCH8509859.1 UDP-N-acetylglucosamine--N-acetylmuramyl-(pentapeptide) pyrophosphoryl-undecaprenol N-acetylglucosamine transferase [Phycisphaerales bacterium]
MTPSDPPNPALLFAGGGTGGHIYPALAIAEHAARLDPGVRVHVLCSSRAVDAEILAKEAVPFTPLPAQPPIPRPRAMIRFARAWLPSVTGARLILEEHAARGPTVLVAMGGFVCPPSVSAALKHHIPVALVNLDAVPGKANRWVAERAERTFTAAEVPQNWPFVGPIVRPALTDPIDPRQARAAFGLEPDTPTLLITGGSQGARSINDLLIRLLTDHPDAFKGWQAIHQTGAQHDPGPVRAAYARAGVRSWVDHYLDDIAGAWAAADLSFGRCGAGTVAEAWATRTPAVFFPYPYHADQHQKRNAQPLARTGAAVILDDLIEPDANAAAHADTILALLTDPARLSALSEPAERLPPADGAERVARALLHRLQHGRFSDA